MSESAGTLSGSWQTALDESGLDARSTEPPDGEETDAYEWFELYSEFATRGFVRALLGTGADSSSIRIQFAIPDSSPGNDLLSAVREEFAELLGDEWRVVAEDPEWELGARLESTPDADTVQTVAERLRDLASVAESGSPSSVDWLAERMGTEISDPGESQTTQTKSTASGSPETSPGAAGRQVFETIGDGSSDEGTSPALSSTGLERWELMETDGSVEARLWLDTPLPAKDADRIGRELTHSLRSRYDITARPLPIDEPDSAGGTELKIRANPASSGLDGPEDAEDVRSDLESYLERLERFDELGVQLAAVLGLDSDGSTPSSPDARSRPTSDRAGGRRDRSKRRKRGSGRREDSGERPDRSSHAGDSRPSSGSESSGRDASSSTGRGGSGSSSSRASSGAADESEADSEKVVLDLGGEEPAPPPDPAVDQKPESGLEAGNYRDPRLMREDATTSLVDVVLRHPGYAEEKMGHNLSILLDVDFPDAMDLVQQAPSIIAWGVGRERALEFKQFIENAGGKVVLVEPDSLKN